MDIANLRTEYRRATLDEAEMDPDPLVTFTNWLNQAILSQVTEPHAMTLATATPSGIPSARIVLLRGFDARGFTFFTNYESQKGQELTVNPNAALVLFWADLERQVRIEGTVTPTSAEESEAYYHGRPPGSKLGAWASSQSAVIPNRHDLEALHAELQAKYPDGQIPRPPHWGGYRLCPQSVEFWQGRPSRLHDRLRYRRDSEGPNPWILERLSP